MSNGHKGCCIRGMLWGLLPLAAIGAAAWIIGRPMMEEHLSAAAMDRLKAAGQGWAAVEMSGRDAALSGAAPSRRALAAARSAALSAWGVRRVDASAATIRPPAPRVEKATATSLPIVISGSWPEGAGLGLVVEVAGRRFVLGRDPALKSDGKGRWTLTLARPLPDGLHDVTAWSTDGDIKTADETRDELVVRLAPPPAPAIADLSVHGGRLSASGTWAAGKGRLSALLDGQPLPAASILEVEDGRWALDIYSPLADGRHELVVKVRDAAGKAAEAKKAFTIDTTAPQIGERIDVHLDKAGQVRISGSWTGGKGDELRASFAGREHVAGKSPQFILDGAGGWTLAPAEPLKPGSYDLLLEARDAAGNISRREVTAAVIVPAPHPKRKPPVRPAQPEQQPQEPKQQVAPLPEPTVVSLMTRSRRPQITGSWPAAPGRVLEVELAGRKYRVGFGKALTAKGDSWTLVPDAPLADGVHDVRVTVRDASGRTATDASRGEVMVDATSPAAPSVRPMAVLEGPVVLSGSWPQGDARSLTVSIAGHTYVLDAPGSPLKSAGKGRWKLALPLRLAPGIYDVKVQAADALGNVSRDQTINELLVKAPPKVVSPKAAPPEKMKGACQSSLDAMLKAAAIHFEVDSARIRPESMELLEKLARILNTCPKTKVLIAGHTDAQGSATYNQSLSERRAAAVSKALVKLGVSADRLRVVGYGESRPVADNRTEEGRAKNRRIEFIITPAQ